jgi:hypothetical protein
LQNPASPVSVEVVRRTYPVKITVNGVSVSRVVIDPHYEIRHRSSMGDELILKLVGDLDQGTFLPDDIDKDGYQYFTYDTWIRGKFYRLIWLLPPERDYLGVVNAYRRRHGRNQ